MMGWQRNTGRIKRLLLAIGGSLAALSGSAHADPSAPAARPFTGDEVAGTLRVAAITRRLLVANAALCPDTQHDYGLVLGAPNTVSWGAPITHVWPDGAAQAAGLRGGDLVRLVNGVPWSADPQELARFDAALARVAHGGELELVVERRGVSRHVRLAGRSRCAIEARLSPQSFLNAAALGRTIVIGGGLERLLRDDAELAFVIGHEAAHVVLGHTAPERQAEIGVTARRRVLEQEADALALGLMARAGYDPAAASRAWLKIADASRPPLHRLLDIHGPYPATAVRAAFLADGAARMTGESGHQLLARRLAR